MRGRFRSRRRTSCHTRGKLKFGRRLSFSRRATAWQRIPAPRIPFHRPGFQTFGESSGFPLPFLRFLGDDFRESCKFLVRQSRDVFYYHGNSFQTWEAESSSPNKSSERSFSIFSFRIILRKLTTFSKFSNSISNSFDG